MAMFARHSHQFRRQSYAWLLALALLLPLAQAAAVWHLIGHHAGMVESRDDPAVSPEHCSLCLIAAVVVSGAPGTEAATAVLLVSPQAEPQPAQPAHGARRPLQAYLSRAPPAVSS